MCIFPQQYPETKMKLLLTDIYDSFEFIKYYMMTWLVVKRDARISGTFQTFCVLNSGMYINFTFCLTNR